MAIKGKAWKYGDDINTDVLYPGRFLQLLEPEEMAQHAAEDLDPKFPKGHSPGDIVVGGRNFGCGSSREQAATALKYAGVGAVIAASFSRLYYRNAINCGLPIIVSPEAVKAIEHGDEVEVDLEGGVVKNVSKGSETKVKPLPEFVMGIVHAGGLIPYLQRKLGTKEA